MAAAARTLLSLALAFSAVSVPAGELLVDGIASARGMWVESQRSWLEGGFGRLGESGAAPGEAEFTGRAQAHLGLDWQPSPRWQLHAHGAALAQPHEARGRDAGLVEAFVAFRPDLNARLSLRFKAGHYFPQTSRENVERLWSSPYTITLSALNSWIGEEVRLTGVEAGLVAKWDRDELQLHGGGFAANDSSGTLLGWRGWAMGDRLVTAGETLPLPPLRSLAEGGAFADQRDDGTRPVEELDDRIGWNARARWQRGGGLLQAAYLDNRGDRALHDGQYAWRTRFAQAGLELRLPHGFQLIAEAASGKTGMGDPAGSHVDVDFRAGYALATWSGAKLRLSARYDRFENRDRDGTAEPNGEEGHSVTLAAFLSPRPYLRLGLEYLDLRAHRPAAAESGYDPDTDARRAQLELRLSF